MDRIRITGMTMLLAALFTVWSLPPALNAASGGEENAGIAGDWLTHYRSARSLGLGGSFTALADEPIGMMWNPAGLTQLLMNEVHVETARLFEGTSVNSFSFAVPGRRFPSLGLSILTLNSGTFERTNEFNDVTGSFEESDMAFVLSAAHDFHPFISAGAGVKVARQSLDEYNDTGIGLDLGMLFRLTPRLSLGASLLNIGGPSLSLRDTDESFPLEVRGGFALKVLSGRALVTAEIVRLSGVETSFHGGTEYWINQNFALRLGLDAMSPAGGLRCRLPHDMKLDYGMENHELGITHRFSLGCSFGGFFARSEADPAVFSPLGGRSVTKFNISSRTSKEVRDWSLALTDKYEHEVRRFGGKGTPPAHVMWDGKADTGAPLPDGVYVYRLTVVDSDGRIVKGDAGTVEIDTSISQVKVPVVVDKR